ncbi:hypothetical protein KY317_01815 [Candidatus Woesearchaeota archaeon]|nr:hypothetical protein [Candidatus Woesearchaeota archaeon]
MPAKAINYNKILSFIFLTLACPVGCGYLSSEKHKYLYITITSTYIFKYIVTIKIATMEKMQEEFKNKFELTDLLQESATTKQEEVRVDTETKERYLWEYGPAYHVLSEINKRYSKHRAHQEKWIVFDEDVSDITAYNNSCSKIRHFNSLGDVLNHFKGEVPEQIYFEMRFYDSFEDMMANEQRKDLKKIFACKIGEHTKCLGPLDYINELYKPEEKTKAMLLDLDEVKEAKPEEISGRTRA